MISNKITKIESNICKKYSLKPSFIMSTSGEFYVRLLVGKNKKYLLKIRKIKTTQYKRRFIKEIKIHHFLKKINTPYLITPKAIISETLKWPEFLLYSFIDSYPLNDFYFYIGARQKNRLLKSPLLDVVYDLQQLPAKKIKPFLKQYKFKENIALYDDYENILNKYVSKQKRKEIRQMLTKNKIIFEQAPMVLTHGDFNPKNILIKNNKVSIIDWSDAHLNNPLFDITYLYLFAWNQNEFKQKIKNFIFAKYDNLKNPDRLYLLNRVLLTPKAIKIALDSIQGIKQDYKQGLLTKNNSERLQKKANRMINKNIGHFLKITDYLIVNPKPIKIIKSIPLFADKKYVEGWLKKHSKELGIDKGWNKINIKNLRLSRREGDQKLISEYSLTYPNKSKKTIMAKIRMERGDDLAKQSYNLLKIIWQDKNTKKLISQPLKFYQKDNLYIYDKTKGMALADLIEQKKINTSQIKNYISAAAKTLAVLHSIDTKKFTNFNFTNNYNIIEQIKWLNFHINKTVDYKNAHNLNLVKKIKKVSTQIKKGNKLIHGDYQLENLIIHRGRIKLIDFDNSEINNPLLDVGNFLNQINYKGLLAKHANQLREIFLNTYLKEVDLIMDKKTHQMINFYIVMGLVKNINYNFLLQGYEWITPDLKAIDYILKNINKSPLKIFTKIKKYNK